MAHHGNETKSLDAVDAGGGGALPTSALPMDVTNQEILNQTASASPVACIDLTEDNIGLPAYRWTDHSIRRVPEGWVFTSPDDWAVVWLQWFAGAVCHDDTADSIVIPPFRFLSEDDFDDVESKARLATVRTHMRRLIDVAVHHGVAASDDAIAVALGRGGDAFETIFAFASQELEENNNRLPSDACQHDPLPTDQGDDPVATDDAMPSDAHDDDGMAAVAPVVVASQKRMERPRADEFPHHRDNDVSAETPAKHANGRDGTPSTTTLGDGVDGTDVAASNLVEAYAKWWHHRTAILSTWMKESSPP
ncbi:Aste57867_9396 [Aphanomyces stellatus]|uniref:Aste57867_9396 protein n=1 Tax=Aphanomyces stellatus TaxID=120398 RepID=A0A485KN75_9STRA|nr:hypothetical protein As57867_009360 [Aphanomyces stellatus]VFT86276.1 Aste57867_9396 [Aphanomyces stellatus]